MVPRNHKNYWKTWKIPLKSTWEGSSLQKVKFFNQDLLIYRTIDTALVFKLDIDFVTLWDDPVQNAKVTIINIFELFKQIALIDADKNCADSDYCGVWERRIFCNITFIGINARGDKVLLFVCKIKISIKLCGVSCVDNSKKSIKKRRNFMEINLFSFGYDFRLIRCRPLPFYTLLKTFLYFHGVKNGNIGLTWANFSVDKSSFHK